jgi:hypothetical protein
MIRLFDPLAGPRRVREGGGLGNVFVSGASARPPFFIFLSAGFICNDFISSP